MTTANDNLTRPMQRALEGLDRGSKSYVRAGRLAELVALERRGLAEHGGLSGWRLTYSGRMRMITGNDERNAA